MQPTPIGRRRFVGLAAAAGAGVLASPHTAHAAESHFHRLSQAGRADGAQHVRRAEELQALLSELVRKHAVPGAVAGVYQDGAVTLAAAGTANLNTGTSFRPDTGFLTGSITKVWTATLAMTFLDEGLIDLHTPLREYLPNLRFKDWRATREMTLWHLLNHSSGLDAGDYILELGEGPEAHRLFVEALSEIGQIHEPGAYASYCNGGWILVGHLLETISGASWHQLLRERVIAPLGLARTFPHAEDGVLYGVAVGSVPDPVRAGQHMATPKFLLPKSFAPAGATLVTTVSDNLAFGRMHMRGGVAENGTRVISEDSAQAMATRTIDHPGTTASGFGLGWAHSMPQGRTMLSHGGGSNGGRALLAVIPELDFGYATFVNSSASGDFQSELQQRILSDVAPDSAVVGARPVSDVRPGTERVDSGAFVGTFRRMTSKTTIRAEGDQLLLTSEWILDEAEGTAAYVIGQPTVFEVHPISRDTLALVGSDPSGPRAVWTFLEPDSSGRFRLMYSGGRLAQRID